MIEDVAGAAIEVLAGAMVPDIPDKRKRRGCWLLFVAVLVVVVIAVAVIALTA